MIRTYVVVPWYCTKAQERDVIVAAREAVRQHNNTQPIRVVVERIPPPPAILGVST